MEESGPTDWEGEEHMFLVCVFNVSPDQPYTIFKAPVSSTAQDIITQVIPRLLHTFLLLFLVQYENHFY